MITDKAVKATIQSVVRGERPTAEIVDPSERGGGRLRLRVRTKKSGVCAEWYATWHRGPKRVSAKIATYPTMSLATARATFREKYLPVILKGENPVGPRAVRVLGRATVRELFEAYVEHLGDRPAAPGARLMLLGKKGAANAIGPNKPAVAVTQDHIIPFLAEIHDRGATFSANQMRNTIHAAFSYAIRSASSYYDRGGATNWGLKFNPVSAIRSNPAAREPRTRALTEREYRLFWRWLEAERGSNSSFDAIRIVMATGQRACEILRLSTDHFDCQERVIRWARTKNGRSHAIPLPRQAFEILHGLSPDHTGLFFNRGRNRSRHTRTESVSRLIRRYIRETGAAHFEARDLRRSWKTLTGAAGLTKSIRDRLQNHALGDVSSRHYDMWDYMREMREGMEIWERRLDQILSVNDATASTAPWPDDALTRLHRLMQGRAWRGSPQSRHHADWIGHVIAEAFNIRRTGDWRKRVWLKARELRRHGVIERSLAKDEKHREVPVFRFADGKAAVLGLSSTALPSGRGRQRVSLGPAPSSDVLADLQRLMGEQPWRSAPQAQRHADWVGAPIATAFGVAKAAGWQKRCVRIAFALNMDGVLSPAPMTDQVGRMIPGVVFSPLPSLEEEGGGEPLATVEAVPCVTQGSTQLQLF